MPDMKKSSSIPVRYSACIAMTLALATAGLAKDSDPKDPKDPKKSSAYHLALIGDFPYTPDQEQKWMRVRDSINADKSVEFTLFDGDIKSGSSKCTDSLYQHRLGEFNTFRNPFVYIFGDNEWTDCHRANNGAYDPLERLTKLRQIFTQGDRSHGEHTYILHRQSENPGFEKFRENVRGSKGPALFLGLNIPGSNNNFGRTPEMDLEYAERNAANLAWMREGFSVAKQTGIKGVMIVIQANPGFELPLTDPNRTGFNDFLDALRAETIAFDGQVVLVHGDSHNFRIDKPMLQGPGLPSIGNFTRVETFGSPNVQWLKVRVDAESPNIFIFDQRIIPGN